MLKLADINVDKESCIYGRDIYVLKICALRNHVMEWYFSKVILITCMAINIKGR